MMQDGDIHRGGVNSVQRIGNTVRRPTGAWTPAVHALLRHLETSGFSEAPRFLGIDEEEREILSFVPGQAAMRPWPRALRSDQGLIALATLLRRYHDAVEGFEPPPNARWRVPGVSWQPGMIIRHGDLGPWNTIWRNDSLTGLIDWDFAEPGWPLEDVAQMAWQLVPLRGDRMIDEVGLERRPDLRHRLFTLCKQYGASVADLLEILPKLQTTERSRIIEFSHQGLEPWVSFQARGHIEMIADETAWLASRIDSLPRSSNRVTEAGWSPTLRDPSQDVSQIFLAIERISVRSRPSRDLAADRCVMVEGQFQHAFATSECPQQLL